MIKVSGKTFSTANRKNFEISIRVSDLFVNLNSFLRYYKNNYYLVMPLWIFQVDAVLRSWIFWTVSDIASSFFVALENKCSWIFWNFEKKQLNSKIWKKFQRKTAWWSLGLLLLQTGVFRTQSNNYNGELFC